MRNERNDRVWKGRKTRIGKLPIQLLAEVETGEKLTRTCAVMYVHEVETTRCFERKCYEDREATNIETIYRLAVIKQSMLTCKERTSIPSTAINQILYMKLEMKLLSI